MLKRYGRRSTLLFGLAATGVASSRPSLASNPGLASAPLEVRGDWRGSLVTSVKQVLARMRDICLSGIPLLSDKQPSHICVENRDSGYPAIWLHFDAVPMAWIRVNVGDRDWCKLSYQFGHELGHVLANSWGPDAKPAPPCQWLEEHLVEAFSLRGLGRLADSWARRPPFVNDSPFASSIHRYREDLIARYARNAAQSGAEINPRKWFSERRAELELNERPIFETGELVIFFLAALESDAAVADLGALNRWPRRSALDLSSYLDAWSASCIEVGSNGKLVQIVRRALLYG